MDDLLVLLDRRGITARMEGEVLRIERPDRPVERIPLNMIGRVVVYGSPMVSCDVWRKLADAGIPAVIFPGRGSGGPACLGSGLSATVMVRLAQHRTLADPEARLVLVMQLVERKLRLQENMLLRLESRPDLLPDPFSERVHGHRDQLRASLATIRRCSDSLAGVDDVDSARGLEGTAATAWFAFLAAILPDRWRFDGRNRRPPRDPVNGLLSLSYTMALVEVRHVVQQRGLDPAVGFLHAPRPGRESLLLDLLEPCRPAVDYFVLALAARDLEPAHFTTSSRYGCRLNKDGRRIYYSQWAEWRLQWPAWTMEPGMEPLPDRADTRRLQTLVQAVMDDLVGGWLGDENEHTMPGEA